MNHDRAIKILGLYIDTDYDCDARKSLSASVEVLKNDRWIPVEERLPEESPILPDEPWNDTVRIHMQDYQRDAVFYGGKFWVWEPDISYVCEEGYTPIKGVTHWRPLPAALVKGVEG
jgi:hypothetical protein